MKKIYLIPTLIVISALLSGCSNSGNQDAISNTAEASGTNALVDQSYDEPFFTYSGTGDDVVSGLTTDDFSFLQVNHLGTGHFSIKAHYDDKYDLLVNTSEPYKNGCTLLKPNTEYTLEINAESAWDVAAYKLGTTASDSFSGYGDCVTPIFLATTNVYTITAEDAIGNFAVRGYKTDGTYDLLVNTIDSYSGRIMFKNTGNYSFFEVTSERAWTIIADDNDTPISVNRNDVDEISADFEKPTDNSNISEIPEDDNADIQGSQNSWLTQEQMDKIADKESARERDTFMLAIAQEDMETYYWGGESQFANVWRQLDIDYNFDTNWIWGIVKNDLDIYNTFDDSDYSDLWIMAGALYDAYKSGDLKDMLGDNYQSVIDDLNSVTKRLGIFYASRELAEANTR